MDPELKALLEKLQKEWAEFRSENDLRLKEVETKGRSDPLTEEKIDKHSKAIGEIEKAIRDLETKSNRPPAGADDEPKRLRGEHSKAFARYLRKGDEAGLEDIQVKATNMTVGSGADGGYIVPQDFDKALYEQVLKYAPMRDVCTVIQVANEKYEQQVNVHGLAGGWVSETGARTATTTPNLFNFKPVFGELYATASASQRLIDDAVFNIEAHITSETGKTFGILENVDFTSGAGVAGTSPKGFLSFTPSLTPTFGTNIGLVKSGTSAVIVADALHDVPAKLLKGYRPGAIWMAAATTMAAVRKLKDSQNRYLWEPSVQAGVPATLLGFPVVENEDMPAVAASANALAFGNFKAACVIADVVGTRMLRDPFTQKPNVIFYSTKRVGFGVRDTSAIVAYQLAV